MQTPTTRRLLCLSTVALSVLAASCGCNDEERMERNYHGPFTDPLLSEIREEQDTDEARCEAACVELVGDDGLDAILACSAYGDVHVDDPWHPENTQADVACITEFTGPGFCTGRRPQGHREAGIAIAGPGSWLAVHAHLERASVIAFVELADWLARRGAPADLIVRCRNAAADEIVHAEVMSRLACEHGASPPPCQAEAAREELLAVALHNAVEGCVHEAFAAIVARHQASYANEGPLRDAFATIADDELRHGQLAWDVHAWLLDEIDETDRERVHAAMRRALADLPARAASNAAATPPGLGWPTPTHARAMACRFAQLLA